MTDREPEPNGSVIVSDKQLLQRAWDALTIWKETYPEGWDCDERLLNDLLTRIAKPQREWVGLTDEEIGDIIEQSKITLKNYCSEDKQTEYARAIEAALKAKNG